MRTNRLVVIIGIVLLSFGFSQAVTTLGIQVGYAGSAFEKQDEAASGFIVGAHFGIDFIPMIEAGIQGHYTVKPFTSTQNEGGFDLETKASQWLIGAYGKLYPIPLIVVDPYVKVGIGYYSGSVETSLQDVTNKYDYDGTIGYQIGIGIELPFGLYGEFDYNIVSFEQEVQDQEDLEKLGANNWMISVGYKF